MRTLVIGAALALGLGVPGGAWAQEGPRALARGGEWVHPHSGIAAPLSLAWAVRAEGTAYQGDLLDVSLLLRTANGNDTITLYIFRATNGDASLWAAQAEAAVIASGARGLPAPRWRCSRRGNGTSSCAQPHERATPERWRN